MLLVTVLFFFFFSRLEEQKNILSEFQRDLNEFIFWLEEVDNITTIAPEPGNEQQLKEKLEQVKVILFSNVLQAYLYKESMSLFLMLLIIDFLPTMLLIVPHYFFALF